MPREHPQSAATAPTATARVLRRRPSSKQSPCSAAGTVAWQILPGDLLTHVLRMLPGVQLCRVRSVCSSWRQCARDAAEDALRARWPGWPLGINPCRQYATSDMMIRTLGPRPSHSWQSEWVDAMVEAMRMQHKLRRTFFSRDFLDTPWSEEEAHAFRETFSAGGGRSMHIVLSESGVRDGAKALRDRGWEMESAVAYVALATNCFEALSPESVGRFPAVAYTVADALAMAGHLQSSAAPPVYAPLTGQYSLTQADPAWRVVLRYIEAGTEPPVGLSFMTQLLLSAEGACDGIFPDGKDDGIYTMDSTPVELDDVQESFPAPEMWDFAGVGVPVLVSGTVVCFRSARPDGAGRHSLLWEEGGERGGGLEYHGACYTLPPYAMVTLLSVQKRWRVRNHTMSCRLLTFGVTWDM